MAGGFQWVKIWLVVVLRVKPCIKVMGLEPSWCWGFVNWCFKGGIGPPDQNQLMIQNGNLLLPLSSLFFIVNFCWIFGKGFTHNTSYVGRWFFTLGNIVNKIICPGIRGGVFLYNVFPMVNQPFSPPFGIGCYNFFPATGRFSPEYHWLEDRKCPGWKASMTSRA